MTLTTPPFGIEQQRKTTTIQDESGSELALHSRNLFFFEQHVF